MNGVEKELYDLRLQVTKDKAEILSLTRENAKDIGLLTRDIHEVMGSLKDSSLTLSSLKTLHGRVDNIEKNTRYALLVQKIVFSGLAIVLMAVLGALVATVIP